MDATGSKSKKRSDASSKPHETLTFFLDRALGNKVIANALRAAGVEVRIHSDHFADDARDEEWLAHVGQQGWIILTKDTRIRYHTVERNALMNARARAFVLVSGNLSGQEMARVFVKALPAIKKFVAQHPPPFIVKVYKDGTIRLLDISHESQPTETH
ncbi:hypothetical protein HYR99_07040 [Candidatus Poribacteria bacterium]|nr:hypothetical protein [Candidatus Poribacteria bacterium]